jgi:anti-sigma factor RsiW
MNDWVCAFENRDEAIVGYLYDDMDPGARRAFEDHLVGCPACSTEVAVLRDVRGDLVRWTPPGPARVLTFDPVLRRRARVWAALADVPTWVQVAAALVILGISLRAANLQVRVDQDGFTVRTGVTSPAPATAPAVSPSGADAPWRAEFAALEQTIRTEVQNASQQSRGNQTRVDGPDVEALLRRVRVMIDASERNQRRELALRVAEMAQSVQAQRTADLQRIQGTFTVLENRTTGEMVKQRALFNNLAMRVSQQQ